MAITTNITRTLNNGYVQVDSTEKNGYKRFYRVPQRNAKVFAKELEHQEKNLKIVSNVTFFASILAGVFGAAHFTKNMESRLIQFLIQTSSAIALALLSAIGFNMYAQSKEINLLKEHQAKEIFYRT